MDIMNYFQSKVEATFSPMDYVSASKNAPEDYVLIDVRNAPAHIRKVKILGSLEISLNELENRLSELPKNKTIVVYCWDIWCNMAAHAAIILLNNGYKVKELVGGISAWQSMKLPTQEL
ncbi:MAG: hypothetical protein LBV71_07045 [Prevotella sp.]|jgi:rhodanese-related sulfurtransferase|nr:hypothetical protein [Prevotella sp.]